MDEKAVEKEKKSASFLSNFFAKGRRFFTNLLVLGVALTVAGLYAVVWGYIVRYFNASFKVSIYIANINLFHAGVVVFLIGISSISLGVIGRRKNSAQIPSRK